MSEMEPVESQGGDETAVKPRRSRAPRIEVTPPGHEGSAAATHSASFEPLSPDQLSAIEAVLLSVDRPLPAIRIAAALGLIEADAADDEQTLGGRAGAKAGAATTRAIAAVRAGIESLNEHYTQAARAFRIESVAGGFRVMTLPAFGPVLERLHGQRERAALSRAALESLAIIAYKQPITRATLEAIRGVACGDILRSLTERRLVTIVGRAEEIGRPILYGTSRRFLETFGLSSLKDLPTVEELRIRKGGEPEESSAEA